MKLKDILQRNPAANPLVNQGQARIAERTSEKVMRELHGELSIFVCEGQYADGIERILESYLANLGRTNQRAAWVSGFFGSGKSHLLKMLCHLWQDTPFEDGSTARSLVPALPDRVRELLRELDTAGKRAGGLLAAAGALPGGSTDHVRLTVLGVLLRAVGLPEQYALAQFCLWLRDQGYFDRVKASVEAAGKTWPSELNNLYVSGPIARAVLACDPNFAADEKQARATLRDQFPKRDTDLSTGEFLSTAKRAMALAGRNGKLPCTILVLDEVQQYIADSSERSTLVTEVAEAVSKQLDSQVIVVAAGQSALTGMPLLQKMMDRFTIRVQLSDTDVETVTRRVLLQKKPTALAELHKLLETHSGEVSRQLQGTRIGATPEDRQIIVEDYPLLPVRRRFWEQCFRQVDAEGTQSQLRSQLRIIHDAVAKLSDRPLGAIVPADELYESLASEMVTKGVLLRELNDRIGNLARNGSEDGLLAKRLCGLVFFIGKLPREAGADLGVRATKEHLGDLLVDDLAGDNPRLRARVEAVLEGLVTSGALMRVGDEVRLQTKEGSEWDLEFRNRQTKLLGDAADLQVRRDTHLYAETERIVRGLKLVQGAAKVPRALSVHREQTPPSAGGESLPVWIRDGWSCALKEVLAAARSAGDESPVIHVFLPLQSADDLKRLLADAEAAEQTLNVKGNPTTDEGKEARRSMESRRDFAMRQRDELARQIVANAKVYLGGGGELMQATLEEKLREAANAALVRLYPRYKQADSGAWEAAIKQAKDGAEQPFRPVGHTGNTEQHPVAQQVLAAIGAGKSGGLIRKELRSSPYGWPQDAIDAALIAMHRSEHLNATLNGAPIPVGQLDQNKIQKADFRLEREPLGVTDRLTLRKLFGLVKVSCKAGEESSKAARFLETLTALAASAGGTAPLPRPPETLALEDLGRLVGNEQLAALRDAAPELEQRIAEWSRARELALQRLPAWELTARMARHAVDLPEAVEPLAQVEAVRDGRLLLDAADHVAPLRSQLTGLLRQAVNEAQAELEQAVAAAMAELEASDAWKRLGRDERARCLNAVGLYQPERADLSTDTALLEALDRQSLAARRTEVDAVQGRLKKALEMAVRAHEPKVRVVVLEQATLHSEEEVRQWLDRQRDVLIEAVKSGPVLVS